MVFLEVGRGSLLFLTILAAILFTETSALAEIIPDSRLAPWQGNVGVPGGIPNRTIVHKNIVSDLGADPTGVQDASAIIENAIRTCPANKVVYIPAGTFKIAAGVHDYVAWKDNFTVRGAGMGRTILKVTGGGAFAMFKASSNDPPTEHAITAGATKGSNTITIDDASRITVGQLIEIRPLTPSWAHILAFSDQTATRIITVTVKVRSKTSTTVTFDPPCPFDFSGMSPIALVYDARISPYLPLIGVGIEDMTFDLSESRTAFSAVNWANAWGCWMKNTEIKGAYSRHVHCDHCVRCEFRGLYHHDAQGSGPSHEGLDFVTGCSWNLVEDSIFVNNAGAPPLILGDGSGGCTANVFAYNYFVNNSSGGYYDISLNHGAHNMLNLVEGNVLENYQDDGYYGSCSHNNLFRNRISQTLRLKHYSTYYSVVGSVLGTSGDTIYQATGNPASTGLYQLGYPNAGNNFYNSETLGPSDPPDYSAEPWHLSDGIPRSCFGNPYFASQCGDCAVPFTPPCNAGCPECFGAQALDLNVEPTLIRHGNYDYVHNAVVWDPGIADHDIPDSLYYSDTPSWWPEGVPWPPIGPDLTPMTSQIPAQIRYATMSAPGPGGLRILP